jgi:predicted membrane-bound spermidine synthase
MIPRRLIDTTAVPMTGEELRLYQRGAEYSIWIGQMQLMSSAVHGSEERLAEFACRALAGMGFTLAAALRELGAGARVTVAELIPAVVAWNRGPLADLAGNPLADPRVMVRECDVALVLRESERSFDAILMDVDNGPEGATREENDWLYGISGLGAAYSALRARGVLAVWSAHPDRGFTKRLRQIGFRVEELPARASGGRKGARHLIWLARRPG